MKRLLPLLSTLLFAATAHAQSMGQPGFYGRIEIGNTPQPPLLISNAVMGNPGIYTGEPIYMHVPPAHAYAWSRHCQLYGACDWLVYFVDNDWYANVYVPGFRSGGYARPTYLPPPVYVVPPYYGHPHHHHPHPAPPPQMRPPPRPAPDGSWEYGPPGQGQPGPGRPAPDRPLSGSRAIGR
ncbi:MAG TPA: hypothetical protein VNZ68_09055 [Rhodocyclaceae bacterium]|nr:hypothetical protein [Rhodocyclaceae bacterium]